MHFVKIKILFYFNLVSVLYLLFLQLETIKIIHFEIKTDNFQGEFIIFKFQFYCLQCSKCKLTVTKFVSLKWRICSWKLLFIEVVKVRAPAPNQMIKLTFPTPSFLFSCTQIHSTALQKQLMINSSVQQRNKVPRSCSFYHQLRTQGKIKASVYLSLSIFTGT